MWKPALLAAALLTVAGWVSAGEGFHGKDPHKGLGGCESKAKIADMKRKFGGDIFHQSPSQQNDQAKGFEHPPIKRKTVKLDRFI